jgi:hypothetical protein
MVELSTVGPSSNGQREEGDSSSSLGETDTVFVTEWSFADHKEAQTTKGPWVHHLLYPHAVHPVGLSATYDRKSAVLLDLGPCRVLRRTNSIQ